MIVILLGFFYDYGLSFFIGLWMCLFFLLIMILLVFFYDKNFIGFLFVLGVVCGGSSLFYLGCLEVGWGGILVVFMGNML